MPSAQLLFTLLSLSILFPIVTYFTCANINERVVRGKYSSYDYPCEWAILEKNKSRPMFVKNILNLFAIHSLHVILCSCNLKKSVNIFFVLFCLIFNLCMSKYLSSYLFLYIFLFLLKHEL